MSYIDNPGTGGGGGSGTVTSVAGGVGITNIPEPITGAGSVNLDIASLTAESVLAAGDEFAFVDVSVAGPIVNQRKVTFADILAAEAASGDFLAQYLLLAGRTGTTNDPLISTDTFGSIYGSALQSVSGLLLNATTGPVMGPTALIALDAQKTTWNGTNFLLSFGLYQSGILGLPITFNDAPGDGATVNAFSLFGSWIVDDDSEGGLRISGMDVSPTVSNVPGVAKSIFADVVVFNLGLNVIADGAPCTGGRVRGFFYTPTYQAISGGTLTFDTALGFDAMITATADVVFDHALGFRYSGVQGPGATISQSDVGFECHDSTATVTGQYLSFLSTGPLRQLRHMGSAIFGADQFTPAQATMHVVSARSVFQEDGADIGATLNFMRDDGAEFRLIAAAPTGTANEYDILLGQSTASTRFLLLPNLFTGIGTATPTSLLHVSGGDLTVTGDAEITGKLTVGGAIDPTMLLLTGSDKRFGATDAGSVYLAPFTDSTTAVQVRAANNTTVMWGIDTTNANILSQVSKNATRLFSFTNTNAAGAAAAHLETSVNGALAGDAYHTFVVNGVTTWAIGVDNSASDAFKVSANATLGTNDLLTMSTAGDVTWAGKVVSYNGIAAEGFGHGLITDVVSLTAQTADIADTNFDNTGVTGLYRIDVYLVTTTGSVAGGAVTANIKFNDGSGAQTVSVGPVGMVTTGTFAQGTVFARRGSGNITYGVTHTGIFSTSQYALHVTCERVA